MVKITFFDPSKHKHIQSYGSNFYSIPKYIQSSKSPDPSKIFLRKKPESTPKRTATRSIVRSLIKSLSTTFNSLSPSDIAAWTIYSSYLPYVNSAFKAFIKINSQLLRPSIPGTSILLSISSPPLNPSVPVCFSAYFLTVSASICVTWQNNYCAGIYIELFRFIPPGRTRFSSQPFLFLCYSISSSEVIAFSIDEQQVDQINQLFIRALNLRGEVSGFAPYNPITKLSMRAGRYGYSSYGYAFYNS